MQSKCIVAKVITSSSEESFEVGVYPYQNANELEKIHENENIDRRRIFYDGKAEFMSEALAQQVVESDNSYVLKKLEIPKQNASYMLDLEDPKPKYKDYITGEFDKDDARSSYLSIVEKLHYTKFVLIHLRRIESQPGETPSETSA